MGQWGGLGNGLYSTSQGDPSRVQSISGLLECKWLYELDEEVVLCVGSNDVLDGAELIDGRARRVGQRCARKHEHVLAVREAHCGAAPAHWANAQARGRARDVRIPGTTSRIYEIMNLRVFGEQQRALTTRYCAM